MDNQPSLIKNRRYYRQVVDFKNLRFTKWGSKTLYPTDMDGWMEFSGKCYVFIEAKYQGAELPRGQRMALQRLADDLGKIKPTLLVIASHNDRADIDLGCAEAAELRYQGRWWKPRNPLTVRSVVEQFLDYSLL